MGWKKWLVLPLLAACSGFSGSQPSTETPDGGIGPSNEGGADPADSTVPIGPDASVPNCPIAKASTAPLSLPSAQTFATTVGAVRDITTNNNAVYWLEETNPTGPSTWALIGKDRPGSPQANPANRSMVQGLKDATAIAIVGDYIYVAATGGLRRVHVSCASDCMLEDFQQSAAVTGRVRAIYPTSNRSMYVVSEGADGAFEITVDANTNNPSVKQAASGSNVGLASAAPGTFWYTTDETSPMLHGVANGVAITPVPLEGNERRNWLASDCSSVYIPRYPFDAALRVNVVKDGKFGPDLAVSIPGTSQNVVHVAIDARYLYVVYAAGPATGIALVPLDLGQVGSSSPFDTSRVAVDDLGVYFGPAKGAGSLMMIPKQ